MSFELFWVFSRRRRLVVVVDERSRVSACDYFDIVIMTVKGGFACVWTAARGDCRVGWTTVVAVYKESQTCGLRYWFGYVSCVCVCVRE